MTTRNTERKPGYTQVCVWEGATLPLADVEEFERLMLHECGVRVQYLEQISTKPLIYDEDDDEWVSLDGERNDLFFAVYDNDVQAFSVKRLSLRIRWIEDVLFIENYQRGDYPHRVWAYQSWDPENMSDPAMMRLGNLVPSNIGAPTICHILPDLPKIV